MAKQIWLYSWLDAGISLSCWMWNRTPDWHKLWAPPYGALAPVTIALLAYGGVPLPFTRGLRVG